MNEMEKMNEKYSIELDNGSTELSQPEDVFEENGTFCRVGSTLGGFIEIDLRITKQRGKEERLVSFSAVNIDENNELSKTDVFLLSETSFTKLKEFMAKLNWND